ncbi:MAG TPA: hypothetical protein ENI41_05130 [Deltaproteobacteria bacterium]|nr:MAG: hypothetical protein DRG83_02320 [Deltaproteobacteria bacterium]HEC31855.1 hypothetical protein [Deltaproteobacteria bacterium]
MGAKLLGELPETAQKHVPLLSMPAADVFVSLSSSSSDLPERILSVVSGNKVCRSAVPRVAAKQHIEGPESRDSTFLDYRIFW